MEVNRIIAEIDAQISKLQQARALLAGTSVSAAPKPGRGRPKGSKNATTKRKRVLSADARKRIADAQRRRWAERRKQTDKK